MAKAAWREASLAAQASMKFDVLLEFADDLSKFSPSDSAYGSIYFTLVGTHHLHVLVGILLELWFFLRLFGGVTRYRDVGLRATAFYWHTINVLAIAVTIVLDVD